MDREEPGRLQSMGSQRVGHDWATNTHIIIKFYFFDTVEEQIFSEELNNMNN